MQPGSIFLGKTRGLRRMANEAGHFTMVALDQRPPIANLVAAKRCIAPSQVSFADMIAVKRLLVEVLGPQASAMLLDPNFAFPAALDRLPARTGMVATLEDHRFQDTPGGRLSSSISDWSVEKIKRAGADGVKVLAWYRPDASPEVLAHQKQYVRQIGEECRRQDIAYVLELLVYPFQQQATHSSPSAQATDKLPQHVLDSVREFARPEYGVDLFKLESPLPGAFLSDTDDSADHHLAQGWFNEMGVICREAGIPWVMLSAGVAAEQFLRVMTYAYTSGANGFLAGRAIWWEALQHFPDLQACREALQGTGIATLQALGHLTRDKAQAWTPDYAALGQLKAEGELCAAYL
jgi:tagatose 1,6-diphosphate aldolase